MGKVQLKEEEMSRPSSPPPVPDLAPADWSSQKGRASGYGSQNANHSSMHGSKIVNQQGAGLEKRKAALDKAAPAGYLVCWWSGRPPDRREHDRAIELCIGIALQRGSFFCTSADYRPPNVLARRGEPSARRLAPGGRWDGRRLF